MPIQCYVCGDENPDGELNCQSCGEFLPLGEDSNHQATYHLPTDTILVNSQNKSQYRIEKTLGEGGFGITYKGVYLQNSLPVAIKENWPQGGRNGTQVIWPSSITPQDKQQQMMGFIREGQYIYECQHPHIVKVYDWFYANDTAYIVMEFLEGKSLESLSKEKGGSLSESQVKKYFVQVCEGLKIVHENNLLHRDIKPDNVMLKQSTDEAVLIDFGNARQFIADKTGNMTRILTPGYAPPEQYSSKGRKGPPLDVYALCATMYKLLTGTPPPESPDRMNSEPLIPPSQIIPNLDPTLERLILTGMKMNARERFQSVEEIIDGLKGKLISPVLKVARKLVKEGKLSEAVTHYQTCIREEQNKDAAVELAIVLMHLNNSDIEKTARQAVNMSPKDGRGYGVLGLLKCRQSNWQEALQLLQSAASLSPHQSWIHANLAWALAKLGKWNEAQTTVEKAIRLDENSSFALGLKAWITANRQKWGKGIASAKKAISRSENSSNNQTLLSWVYPCYIMSLVYTNTTIKTAKKLNDTLEEFITKIPQSAFAYGIKGWQEARQGLWKEALVNFQIATNKPLVSRWILLNQAITEEHFNKVSNVDTQSAAEKAITKSGVRSTIAKSNTENAIATYHAYEQKFSSHNAIWLPINQSIILDMALVYFRLGTLYGKTKQWQQAKVYLEKAINFHSEYAEAYHNLGWVLLNIKNQQGDVENVHDLLSKYERAIQLYQQQQKLREAQQIDNCFQNAGVPLNN